MQGADGIATPSRRHSQPASESPREEASSLALAAAEVLFASGQSTERVVTTAEQLADRYDVDARLLPRWGELGLQTSADLRLVETYPMGIEMTRVAAVTLISEQAVQGRLAVSLARAAIAEAARSAPAPTWLFVFAAAAGAAALSTIFGAQHVGTAGLIAVSAGAGALVRRLLARISSNPYLQPFTAALLAGVLGAVAERFHLSSSLRLIAVCPCMILVPGPHILNGGLDLLRGRVHLGTLRLVFASLIVLAISCGLILGLRILGIDLPVDPPGRTPPLWQDVAAAGVAVAAYSVFFNTPAKMLPWPIAIGAFAHALRWLSMACLGFGPAGAALSACAVVGIILTPVADRLRIPFTAVAFAAVVSMIPGVFLFRMASGLVQIGAPGSDPALISSTIADGVTAATIILAMMIGLLVPKLFIDEFRYHDQKRPSEVLS